MAQRVIVIEVGRTDTDDTQVLTDTLEALERVLPYMWDNIRVTAHRRDSLDMDNDGQRTIYIRGE